jgi:hypothetical protein
MRLHLSTAVAAHLLGASLLAPWTAHAATRVSFEHASVVFPRGEPTKRVSSRDAAARVLAEMRAKSPGRRFEPQASAMLAADSWGVTDRAHGVRFQAMETSTARAFGQEPQMTCPAREPAALRAPNAYHLVRVGSAIGREYDRSGPGRQGSAMLTISRGGRTYILSYTQLRHEALARLHATPANEDPQVFFNSFRLDGASPASQ